MHIFVYLVRWKHIIFCRTGLEASRIIVEVTGNALTVDTNTEVISGSRDTAAMTESSDTLFFIVMGLDDSASAWPTESVPLYFIIKL